MMQNQSGCSDIPEHSLCVKAGACLGSRAGQVTVTHHLCIGEEFAQSHQQKLQLLRLLRGARVGGTALWVESALVAYAYGAAVVGTCVRSHLKQAAVLGHHPGAAYVEVVAHGAETASAVVAQELLHGVVTVGACGCAVDDDVPHAACRRHQHAVLDLREQLALGENLVSAYEHRECVVNHIHS